MNKKLFFCLVYFFAVIISVHSEPQAPPVLAPEPRAFEINALEPIENSDRILILAPHPDDETIGCAGIIQQALKKKASLHILYLTNGDHNQFAFMVYEKRLTFRKGEFIHMGRVRRNEALYAMKLLGLNENNLIFLGYPDFGTFIIFRDFWNRDKPYKSLLTRVLSVPYREDFSFGALNIGENIVQDLKEVLKKYRPNKIFVSHPADLNFDHKALYLFLEIALADLHEDLPRPKIYYYLVHWKTWPLPRRYHPELSLTPAKEFKDSQLRWHTYELSSEELEKKHQAILCYKSQTESSAFYLLSFARKNELFSDYPENIGTCGNFRLPKSNQIPLKENHLPFFDLSRMFSGSMPHDFTATGLSDSYGLEDNLFLIHIDKDKDLDSRLRTLMYLFGYSYKTPFGQMPKIRVVTKCKNFKIFNSRKMINPKGVILELKPSELILKIPLDMLGNPDFVLVSINGYLKAPNADSIGFRKINIKDLSDLKLTKTINPR